MKIYNKIILILLALIIFLNPLILSTSKFKVDYLIYLLFIVQVLGFIIFKYERKKIIKIIKTIFNNKIMLSLILLNCIMYLSTIFATDKRISFTHSIRFSMYIFIFYSISYCINNKDELKLLIYSLFSSTIIITLYSIKEIIQYSSEGITISRNYRIASLLENSNNLGAFSMLTIFLAFMFFIKAKNIKSKLFYGIIITINILNLIVCQSRNVLLGMGIGFFVLLVLYNIKFIFLGVLAPLLLVIPKIQHLVLNFLSLTPESSRYRIWLTTNLMINDHPLSGIGYKNFPVLYQSYVDLSKETLVTMEGYGWIAQHPHNMFLEFQVETGVLGTIALIAFILITFIFLFKSIGKGALSTENKIITGVSLSFSAFIAINIFDSYFSSPKIMMLIFSLLGFAYCSNRLKQNRLFK